METSTVINSDGTVTIPKEILETYGIRQGARVTCVMNGYQLEMHVLGTKLPPRRAKPGSGYGMAKSNRPPAPVDLNIGDPIE